MTEHKTIQDWAQLGFRKQFLSPKAHLKQLVNNTNIDQYTTGALQFAKKCSRRMFKFKPPVQEILTVSTNMDYILAYEWLAAVRELQSGTKGNEKKWRQVSWLGGQYVRLELTKTRYRQHVAKQNGQSDIQATATFHMHAAILKNFLRLGELDAAIETSRNIDDMVAINGYFDFNDPDVPSCTGALIATLVLEKHGQKVSTELSQRFRNDELVSWFYDNWNTGDLDSLKKHLELLCDRHTQMSRYYSNQASYEFPRIDYFYDISEVLSILRLREIAHNEIPALSHKLLDTPMGALMDKAPVEKMGVYETLIDKCIAEFENAIAR